MKSRLFNYVVEAVSSPIEQLSRGQQFVRQSWGLTLYCARQLRTHRAEGMAAELTYRTVFSLIPVVVLGLVMFRIFGGLEEFQNKVEYQLYDYFGVPEIVDGYQMPKLGEGDAVEATNPTLGDSPGAADSSDPGSSLAAKADSETSTEASQQAAQEAKSSDRTATADDDTSLGRALDGAGLSDDDQKVVEAVREATNQEAAASIRKKLHDIVTMVASIDFRSIGVFGLLLFIYAAVALADAVEHLFNRIYDAPSQRPILIRVAIHWSIITLGSGLLAMSLYMSSLVVEHVAAWSGTTGGSSTLRWILSHFLSVVFSWFLLYLLYSLMPNTHVSNRAALIGALVGSLLWEAAKFGFQIYVVKAMPYSNIYGSLGLIPLFLFWIYVTWLIVLFGLILTYTLQTYGGRLPRELKGLGGTVISGDPDWMLPIMCEVGRAFESGKAINQQALAERLGLSSRVVHEMTDQLLDAGMLRRVSGEDESLTLARPADRIEITDVLDLAHHVRPTNDHPAWRALADLKKAERDAAVGKSLADLVEQEVELRAEETEEEAVT